MAINRPNRNPELRRAHLEERIAKLSINPSLNTNLIKKAERQLRKILK